MSYVVQSIAHNQINEVKIQAVEQIINGRQRDLYKATAATSCRFIYTRPQI